MGREEYTKEFLETQNILMLRCIGLNVGVRAPTSKKRSDLIESILAVQRGDVAPHYSSKSNNYIVNANSFGNVSRNDIFATSLESVAGQIVFNRPRPQENGEVITGYVYENETSAYIVSYENPMMLECVAELPKNLFDRNRLRVGHFVKVQVMNGYKGFPVVMKILEVEGQPYKGFSFQQFEYRQVCFVKQKYYTYLGQTVNYGDRVLYCGNGNDVINDVLDTITRQYNYCESLVYIGLNLTPERINEIKKYSRIEEFHTLFSESMQAHYFTYKLAIEHAKRLTELGKRVILVVANIDMLLDVFELDDDERLSTLRSLFGLARSFEGAGSLTIIGTCSLDFYEKTPDFKNYIDMKFKLDSEAFYEGEDLRALRGE